MDAFVAGPSVVLPRRIRGHGEIHYRIRGVSRAKKKGRGTAWKAEKGGNGRSRVKYRQRLVLQSLRTRLCVLGGNCRQGRVLGWVK